jgi:hypothetical protein
LYFFRGEKKAGFDPQKQAPGKITGAALKFVERGKKEKASGVRKP